MKKLVIVAALALLASPVLAQDSGIESALLIRKGDSAVVIKGKCIKFDVGGVNYPCKLALYMHFSSGRTAIQFDTPGVAFEFSGGSDSQIDRRRHILNVDRISGRHADGSSQPHPAKGRCMVVAKDLGAKYIRSISCKASNGTDRVDVEFQGTGKIKKL